MGDLMVTKDLLEFEEEFRRIFLPDNVIYQSLRDFSVLMPNFAGRLICEFESLEDRIKRLEDRLAALDVLGD